MSDLRCMWVRAVCSHLVSLSVLSMAVLGTAQQLAAQAPSITSLSPTTAKAGDAVTITGTGFGTAYGTVKFGDTLATSIQSWSNTSISATVPNIPAGSVHVIVHVGASDISAPQGLTVMPNIASISPSPAKPGDTVSIAGTGFGTTSGTVKFGDTAATTINPWSNASISATVPVVKAGNENVVVSVAGNDSVPYLFAVSIPTIPITVTPEAVKPDNGRLPLAIFESNCNDSTGTDLSQGSAPYSLMITGSGLSISPSLNANKCAITSSLTIGSSVVAGSYKVILSDRAGNPVGSAGIEVLGISETPAPPPTIKDISPHSASAGATVTITGTNFGANPGSVKIGSATGNIKSWSDPSIELIVPSIPVGPASTVVASEGGQESAPFSFTVSPQAISIAVTPQVIQPVNGKLPASVSLAVFESGCDDKNGTDLTQGGAPYALTITGSGLSLSPPNATKCTLTSTLTIDPNTPPGDYDVMLADKSGNPVAHAKISVMGTSAGAIPPGLAPQVDVMWGVVPEAIVHDNFGHAMAGKYYCIELVIGNNTGYPLQIASVGFDLNNSSAETVMPTNGYHITRATLENQQSLSPRRFVRASLVAGGILLSGVTPFFHKPNRKANLGTVTGLVSNQALAAFDLIWPDLTIDETNRLDDQMLKDGLTIPNNTQVRTVVFVAKNEVLSSVVTQASKPAAPGQIDEPTECYKGLVLKKCVSTANIALALGKLHLEGRKIQYLERVQVQASASQGGVSVTISPTAPSVQVKTTQPFTAAVAGTGNGTVTWSVACTPPSTDCGKIDSTGQYTAPAMPPSTVTVTATSAADNTKSASTNVTITPELAFTTTSLPPGTANQSYAAPSITATGGTGPYTYSITGGTPPAWLKLSPDGVLSGTPTAATTGTAPSFTVTATDSSNPKRTGSVSLSITVTAGGH